MHTDAEILIMLRDNTKGEQGFRSLMDKYGPPLYWHIRRIVIGHEDTQDVFQEASIQIYQHLNAFTGKSEQLQSWIYRIATNKALDHLRSQTHFFQSIESLQPQLLETLTTECSLNADETEMLLQRAVLALPTQQRLVFNLRYYDELPYETIAEILGKKVGTLKTNYSYAVEKVKKVLQEGI